MRTPRSRWIAPGAVVAVALLGVVVVVACGDAGSCPPNSCDPATNGSPFDLLQWCQDTGECTRDGKAVPACPGADADPAPACALSPYDASETLTFPIGPLAHTLGGRRDLVFTYTPCQNRDSGTPVLHDVRVLLDGEPAACKSANPCDPSGTPTVTTCADVPATVSVLTISFSYGDAEGKTAMDVQMQDTSCSYFCK